MADTVIIALNDATWTEVSTSSGFMTNEQDTKVVYREAGTLPGASVRSGHTLEIAIGAFVQFELIAGQQMYARSVGGAGRVAITPGDA